MNKTSFDKGIYKIGTMQFFTALLNASVI